MCGGGESIGACERKGEREGKRGGGILRERKKEGASGSNSGLPLKHCSLSFASLRKQGCPSCCLTLLLTSSVAALL